MKPIRALCFLFYLLIGACAWAAEDPLSWEIRSENDQGFFEFDLNESVFTFTNRVSITYSNAVLTADKAVANEQTGDVTAEGNVIIKAHGVVWTGEQVTYNFRTQRMTAEHFRAGAPPVFISGDRLSGNQSNQTYSAKNIVLTTDDYAEPTYKIRASRLTIVPGKHFEAEEATVRIGNVPVFYFPRYRRAIGYRVNHFDFTPGYRSYFGPYLLTTYRMYSKEALDGFLRMDYRQRRGIGIGPGVEYRSKKWGDGTAEYYYAHDENSGDDSFTGQPIPRERHRVAFSHQVSIRTNLTAKAVVNYQSDSQVEHDFFEDVYRRNVQPKSFLEVNQAWPNFTLDFLAQPQVNDFIETVERLPDVKLTALRQQLGGTPLFYEGESSVGYFNRRFVDNSTNYAGARADTFHQIILPKTFFGWLVFTPRAGARVTYYEEADGPGATTQEEARTVFNTGGELSFKSSRVWAGAENKAMDLDGIRHIFEPSLNYAFVPRPEPRPRQLPQYDPEFQSLRTLPIEFPQYNSIDAIDSQNVLRVGMRNRLQTKREGFVQDFVAWNVFADWRIKPAPDQSTFAPLTSSLEFRPRNWLTLQSDNRYDLDQRRVIESDHHLVLEPNQVWSMSLGHRYLDTDAGLGLGHNLFRTSFYYRANENWAARVSHHFEARDGTLEEQLYSVYRDLRSWTAALTFRVRDNRGGGDDFTIAATFSLKAFPRFGLNSDRDRPSLLVGY